MPLKQRGFLLYLDNYELIEDLTDVEKGQWIDAIFLYKRDGIITDFQKGTLLKTAFKVVKSQLDRDSEAWAETCQKRVEAGRKGGLAKATNAKRDLAKATNAKRDLANLADNDNDIDIDNVSVIDTDTDIVNKTDTERSCGDFESANCRSASASAKAEPTVSDLFSIKQLMAKVKKNSVNLTEEGVKEFYDQMQDDNWELYGAPIEKKFILRALREYAKTHPEYALELQVESDLDTAIASLSGQRKQERKEQEEQENKVQDFDINDEEAVNAWLREEFGEDVFNE